MASATPSACCSRSSGCSISYWPSWRKNKAALATLFLELTYERSGKKRLDAIRPAEPTLDVRALLSLVHLRLESEPPRAAVKEVLISAEEVPATHEQLSLWSQRPRRDLRAAAEAFARIRAELGNDAIVRATLREGHLPEARYGWEPLAAPVMPEPRAAPALRPMIRRVRRAPQLLPAQSSHVRDDGWLLRGLEHGAVTHIVGPYVVFRRLVGGRRDPPRVPLRRDPQRRVPVGLLRPQAAALVPPRPGRVRAPCTPPSFARATSPSSKGPATPTS